MLVIPATRKLETILKFLIINVQKTTLTWPRYARMYEIDKLCYLDTQGGWDKLSSVKYEKLLPGTKILITV